MSKKKEPAAKPEINDESVNKSETDPVKDIPYTDIYYTNGVPNPGSDDAVSQGCTCPVLDNGHGVGIIMDGQKVFWHNEHCPIHGIYREQLGTVEEVKPDNPEV